MTAPKATLSIAQQRQLQREIACYQSMYGGADIAIDEWARLRAVALRHLSPNERMTAVVMLSTGPERTELWDGKTRCHTADFECDDCHVGFMMYSAEDSVWQAAGLVQHNNVCIPCLSRRLARELTLTDFTDALVNGPIGYLKNQKKILRQRARRRLVAKSLLAGGAR